MQLKQNIILLCLIAVTSLCGCSRKTDTFNIDGKFVNGRTASKAYLYAFLEEYRKIRLVDSADVKKNRFAFSGRCSEPTEAFILFDDKSSISFILSANDLTAEIGKNSYIVTGSSDNEHLSRLMMQQHRAVNERIRLQKVYKKMQTDSTLTKEAEDSLLNCYRSLSVDLRKNVEATLADTTRPLLVRQTRRLLSFTLAPDTIK